MLALTGICSLDSADSRDEQTTSVTSFIRKCIGDVVPTVKFRCFLNQKPLINTEAGAKLKDKAIADNSEATTRRLGDFALRLT